MRFAIPLFTFALLAAPAAAQTAMSAAGGQTPEHHGYLNLHKRFEIANATHDGRLTLDQAKSAKVMRTVARNFDAIDATHKGFVTEDDIRAWYKARRAARQHGVETSTDKS